MKFSLASHQTMECDDDGTGHWCTGQSVRSLLPAQPPFSAQMSRVACVSTKTIVFAVPELVMPERLPTSMVSCVIRLLAGHWKMDVLLAFMQAVNSTAIWLHEFTSLAAE